VPFALNEESIRRGFGITVAAFPAEGFATTFRDAVTRNEAPDVLVFDNHGVMSGITTALGKFEGIGEDPRLRPHFVRVTGAFDELLGPERGWTYLFAFSPNHEAAKRLALRTPDCPSGSSGPKPEDELIQIVPKVATAYLNGDESSLGAYSDPDRLPAKPSATPESVAVGAVATCGVWGNGKLAFASANASYEADTKIGHSAVLLVFRKPAAQWQLLAAARDPVSNGRFLKEIASLPALLASDERGGTFPASATLLFPSREFPRPSPGQRFGVFTWRASASDDVVAEIAEFAYHDDARLFLKPPVRPNAASEISAGQLWTTKSEWTWRIWSVSRGGDIVFSDVGIFHH
jgi:hypothetical protein